MSETHDHPTQVPNPAPETIMQVLNSELIQVNNNRYWLLARNAELEDELRATRAELEAMRLADADNLSAMTTPE